MFIVNKEEGSKAIRTRPDFGVKVTNEESIYGRCEKRDVERFGAT